MICLLDTNIISQKKAKRPGIQVLRFLNELPSESAFLSVITLMEVRAGIERLDLVSKHREQLEDWLVSVLPNEYAGRVLPVTAEVANETGHLLTAEKKASRTPYIPDLLIAATAKIYGMTVVTMNRKHFETLDVPLIAL